MSTNPSTSTEPVASDAPRLVVVGAGPAGMATAITLAERGLDFWLPLAGSNAMAGLFGSPVLPPEGALAGVRLLSLLGRTA